MPPKKKFRYDLTTHNNNVKSLGIKNRQLLVQEAELDVIELKLKELTRKKMIAQAQVSKLEAEITKAQLDNRSKEKELEKVQKEIHKNNQMLARKNLQLKRKATDAQTEVTVRPVFQITTSGGTTTDPNPAIDGLVDTLST